MYHTLFIIHKKTPFVKGCGDICIQENILNIIKARATVCMCGMRLFSGGESPPLRILLYIFVGRRDFCEANSPWSEAEFVPPPVFTYDNRSFFSGCRGRHPLPVGILCAEICLFFGMSRFSSAYEGTKETQSATKKPHKKRRNPPIFVGEFQHFIGLLKMK